MRSGLGSTLPLVRALALERALVPAAHRAPKLLVLGVAELELVPPQPVEPAEHLGEQSLLEAQILLGRELAESIEPVTGLQRHEVCEVASLGASEHGEHLVDGELLPGECRRETSRLGREQPGVRREVDFCALVAVRDDQANEAGIRLCMTDNEPRCAQGATNSGRQPVDVVAAETEEVEVASAAERRPV